MNTKGSEDKEREINPKEVNREDQAKGLKSKEKIDIKESEMGREVSQNPGDEHVERITQIDDSTKKLQQENHAREEKYDLNSRELSEEDNRDSGNGTDDWDAENNRSGRRK